MPDEYKNYRNKFTAFIKIAKEHYAEILEINKA